LPDHDSNGSHREGTPGARRPGDLVRFGLIFYGAMAVVAVLWRSGIQGQPILFGSPAAAQRGVSWGLDLAIGLAAGGAVLAISHWMTRYTAWGEALARALAGALDDITVPNALLLALTSGMAEEMLFRGALQPRVGWLAASLLFGLLHFVPRREFLPWTGFAVLVGFLFGALFLWTGNLVAPVVAHVLVNAVNLPILIRDYGPGGRRAGDTRS
jgi:membrane protease YdiL (CAAX protease family)